MLIFDILSMLFGTLYMVFGSIRNVFTYPMIVDALYRPALEEKGYSYDQQEVIFDRVRHDLAVLAFAVLPLAMIFFGLSLI